MKELAYLLEDIKRLLTSIKKEQETLRPEADVLKVAVLLPEPKSHLKR